MTTHLGFKCNTCGSTEFSYAHTPPEDDDIMTCARCNREFGKVGDIKVLVEKQKGAIVEKWQAEANKKALDS